MTDTKFRDDIETTDEGNERVDLEPINFWEEKQRELVTSVVDYNLGTLADLITNKDIDLSPKYQRRFRWDNDRQSKLVESFLMNVPVPPIFLNEDSYGQYSVIDGKQRLTAIHNFLRGRLVLSGLSVFGDINNQSFDGLPPRLQTVLRTRVTIRAVIILRQSDPDVKFEVFRRLNTGGVKLNAQEIRNSVYPGPLNNLILELSEHRRFHRLLGIRISSKDKSALYQEMRDAEFVLRYFTFKDSWNSFTGGMRRHMDIFMSQHQRMGESEVEKNRDAFLHTLEVVEACFGENTFQRWIPEKGQWRQQVLASLFDAQMFGVQGFSVEAVRSKREQIIQGLQNLFNDTDFRRAVDAATNTPSFFRLRIEKIRELIRSNVL